MALGWRGTRRQREQEEAPGRREVQRIEERQRALADSTEKWRSLLREMEHAGQSADPRYETYYQAYLQAREKQKQVDLELFNLRRGLAG
jgi:hypothetical protein